MNQTSTYLVVDFTDTILKYRSLVPGVFSIISLNTCIELSINSIDDFNQCPALDEFAKKIDFPENTSRGIAFDLDDVIPLFSNLQEDVFLKIRLSTKLENYYFVRWLSPTAAVIRVF